MCIRKKKKEREEKTKERGKEERKCEKRLFKLRKIAQNENPVQYEIKST